MKNNKKIDLYEIVSSLWEDRNYVRNITHSFDCDKSFLIFLFYKILSDYWVDINIPDSSNKEIIFPRGCTFNDIFEKKDENNLGLY